MVCYIMCDVFPHADQADDADSQEHTPEKAALSSIKLSRQQLQILQFCYVVTADYALHLEL